MDRPYLPSPITCDPSAGVFSVRLRDAYDGANLKGQVEPDRNEAFTRRGCGRLPPRRQMPKRTKWTALVQIFCTRTRAPGYGACKIMPLPA